MNRIYMIILLLNLLSFPTAWGKQAISKTLADSLYAKEQFDGASEIYESVLSNQGESAAVYYNLGNCYYKQENFPRAILNYERALLLDPSDGDIRANLMLARAKTTDRIAPPSEMFFITWWKGLTNMMNIEQWAILAVSAFVLMLIGLLLYMFVSNLTARKIGIYSVLPLLFIVIVANLCAYTQHRSLTNRNHAIVIAPAVTVKSSPSESSTDLFVVHEGSKVEILDKSMSGWREVKLEEGKQGWVQTDELEVI